MLMSRALLPDQPAGAALAAPPRTAGWTPANNTGFGQPFAPIFTAVGVMMLTVLALPDPEDRAGV